MRSRAQATLATLLLSVGPNPPAHAADNLALYDDLVAKVQAREAFSPIKDANWGETFESRLQKWNVRQRFLDAGNDTELYRAINLLSAARRDTHLEIDEFPGGVNAVRRTDRAPLRFMADYTGNTNGFMDVSQANFFVSQKGADPAVASVGVGDRLVRFNDQPVPQVVEFFMANFEMSTHANGYWREISDILAEYKTHIAQDVYRPDQLVKYTFERPDKSQYSITIPYAYDDDDDVNWIGANPATTKSYPGYNLARSTIDYRLWRPSIFNPTDTIVLEWIDFENLPSTVPDLMNYAQANGLLDHDVVVDTTISSGGGLAPLLIQRFADDPFQATLGNIRCSDITDNFAATQGGLVGAWLDKVVLPECEEGAEYSDDVPFKLQFEGPDEDGVLDPAAVRFTGDAILLMSPEAGSQIDQFTSMWIDNQIGLSMGMPSGGYSNTWEWDEDAEFPDDGSGAVEFAYNIGHTIRPNGEVLEGNPAEPLVHFPLTHDNFQTYFGDLFAAALEELDRLDATAAGDFNDDGVVDALDYAVWREAEGQSVFPGTAADADGSGVVDAADLDVWRERYGDVLASSAIAVPEPCATVLMVSWGFAFYSVGRRRPRRFT